MRVWTKLQLACTAVIWVCLLAVLAVGGDGWNRGLLALLAGLSTFNAVVAVRHDRRHLRP